MCAAWYVCSAFNLLSSASLFEKFLLLQIPTYFFQVHIELWHRQKLKAQCVQKMLFSLHPNNVHFSETLKLPQIAHQILNALLLESYLRQDLRPEIIHRPLSHRMP